MAVLASLSSRTFTPQVREFAFGIDADLTQLVVTLTHPDWPEGECVRIDVLWPDGRTGTFSTNGGPVTDKAGNPTGGTRSLTWTCHKPAGVTSGEARIEVVQTLTSAMLVEGF
jgi:hypothetical protein